jgi:hypothetical protein
VKISFENQMIFGQMIFCLFEMDVQPSRRVIHQLVLSALIVLSLTLIAERINSNFVLESQFYGSYSGGATGIYSWYPEIKLDDGIYAWTPTVESDRTIWPNSVDSLDPPDYSGPFAAPPRRTTKSALSLIGIGRNFNPDDIGFGGQAKAGAKGNRPHLVPYDPYGYASVDHPNYGYGTFARHAGPGGGGDRYLYMDGFPYQDGFQQYAADAQNSQYALDQARYANWSRAYDAWSEQPPPGAEIPRWTGETPAWYRARGGARRAQLRLRGAVADGSSAAR